MRYSIIGTVAREKSVVINTQLLANCVLPPYSPQSTGAIVAEGMHDKMTKTP